MTTSRKHVRTNCILCDAENEVAKDELFLRICVNTDVGDYRFRCSECGMQSLKLAEDRTLDLLILSGVELREWHLPEDLFIRHSGPQFTHDDLIDFHDRIEQADTLVEFLV